MHWVVGGTAQACDAADRLKEGVVVVVVVGERTGSWEWIERRRRETRDMKTARPGPCESHGQVLQNGTGRRLGPAGR